MADDLDALARDLGQVARKLGEGLGREVRAAGERARDDWREQIRPNVGRRLRHLPAAVTSEVRAGRGYVEAEVGYDKDRRQGPLGNIAEFGTSRHGPVAPARDAVADAEEPRFAEAVHDLTGDLL